MLAVALTAMGMVDEDPNNAKDLFLDSRTHFSSGLVLERDEEQRTLMLIQLRDMYKSEEKVCMRADVYKGVCMYLCVCVVCVYVIVHVCSCV